MAAGGDSTVLKVRGLRVEIASAAGVIHPVDDISLDLRAGETLGLVGESGSGKSMTGLALLRLLPRPAARIVAGRIELDGTDLVPLSEGAMRRIRGRRIAMILQDPQASLNPAFTIGNQLFEALRAGDRSPRQGLRARAAGLLRLLGLPAPEERLQAYPHQLSGGMRQRVVGAIALASDPQVIVADEPTTALDLTIQAQYLALLEDIQKRTGVAILFITHDFGVVARLCHRVAVMYAGRIVEQGDVRDIFDRPSHPYTAALIRSVPSLTARAARLPAIAGQPPPLSALPAGCSFAPRCAHAQPRCLAQAPPELPGRGGAENRHVARCWRLEDPSWTPD